MSRTTEWDGVELYPHQVAPANSMACEDGIRATLLFYSVGSGKTLTALYTIYRLAELWKDDPAYPRVVVIAPAKVIEAAWKPEIARRDIPADRFTLLSFELARMNYQQITDDILKTSMELPVKGQPRKRFHHTILVVDEAHTIRTTGTSTFHSVFAIAAICDRVLLLTGTPMINGVGDMDALLRVMSDDAKPQFKPEYFVDKKTLVPRHLDAFKHLFTGRVFTHRTALGAENFPDVDYRTHEVPMYPLQKSRYNDFVSEMLTPALKKMLQEGIISTALNSFLTRTRAISNTVGHYTLPGEHDDPSKSSKFRGIRTLLLENAKPAVVYSFFKENGVLPMKSFIDDTTSLRTALIAGDTTHKELERILLAYNVDKEIDVLFITSAVRQGITLKGTRELHIMEPGWNESLEDQIVGRVARFGSHAGLPKKERHVEVHHWITVTGGKTPSTDQYISDIAMKKSEVITKFEQILEHLRSPHKCGRTRLQKARDCIVDRASPLERILGSS